MRKSFDIFTFCDNLLKCVSLWYFFWFLLDINILMRICKTRIDKIEMITFPNECEILKWDKLLQTIKKIKPFLDDPCLFISRILKSSYLHKPSHSKSDWYSKHIARLYYISICLLINYKVEINTSIIIF